jgi:transmembrane sensor
MKGVSKNNIIIEDLRDMVDEQRIVYNWQQIGIKRKQKRFSPVRQQLIFVSALVLIAAGVVSTIHFFENTGSAPAPLSFELSGSTRMIAVPSKATAKRRIPLSDGSTITLAPGTSLEVKDNEPTRFRTSLHRGWVRYNVIPGQTRTWIVDAELCRVVVIGTQFTVNRTAHAVHIAVHRGTVAVYPPTGEKILATLTAGETYALREPRQDVSKRLAYKAPPTDKTQVSSVEQESEEERRPRRARTEESGSNRNARIRASTTKLAGLGGSSDVNHLLKKVDDARDRGNPKKATALLEQIVREHPTDPAIGLVALTLGNIRLDTLRQPRAAALAFKQAATSKGLPSSLREQAYARCVEAFHRAGDVKSTKKMSEMYTRRFPNGTWLSWIERWTESE